MENVLKEKILSYRLLILNIIFFSFADVKSTL